MKKIILAAFLFAALSATAQKTYNLDAPKEKKPKTEVEMIGTAERTADVALYKGQTYPVYKSSRGALFILYTNSKGNLTKKYLPKGI